MGITRSDRLQQDVAEPAAADILMEIVQTFANEHRKFFQELIAVGVEGRDGIRNLEIWGLQNYDGFSSHCDRYLYYLKNQIIEAFPELENRVTKAPRHNVPREVLIGELEGKAKKMAFITPAPELQTLRESGEASE